MTTERRALVQALRGRMRELGFRANEVKELLDKHPELATSDAGSEKTGVDI